MNLCINVVTYDCLVQNILNWFNLLAMVWIVGVHLIILQIWFTREKTQNLARKNIDCTLSNYFQAVGIKDYKRSEYHVKLQSGRVSKVRSGGAPAAWQGGGKSFYTLLCFTWLGLSSLSLLPSSSMFLSPCPLLRCSPWLQGGCRQKLEHPGRLRLGAAGGGREEAKNNPSGQDLPPILPNLHLVYHQHCIAWPCQVGVGWYRKWKKTLTSQV